MHIPVPRHHMDSLNCEHRDITLFFSAITPEGVFTVSAARTRLWILLSYRIMPESVRWLVSQGRKNDAIKIINKAAKVNGVEVPKHLLEETNPEVVHSSLSP